MPKQSVAIPLNFPPYSFKTKVESGKYFIFDAIRKKYVSLEPEEWVRQHLVKFLIEQGYPTGLFSIEKGHHFNKLLKRTDVLVYATNGKPVLLAECKAPTVKPNKALLEQAINYNRVVKAPVLLLSNGLQHFFIRVDFTKNSSKLLESLPSFQEASAWAQA